MADDEHLTPEDAQRAIERASRQTPTVSAARDKLLEMAENEENGLRLLAEAIRRMLREG
ncbi:MAG TPA: hypothetical protein VD978_03185 [Azospirillum sp.]|nr:hypothetical protein [Azospirillum sp.]